MMETGMRRDAWKIRGHLRSRGMGMKDVQRALGLNNYSPVRETIVGKRNHRKVLAYLIELGCPERWLDLPEDMKARRAA